MQFFSECRDPYRGSPMESGADVGLCFGGVPALRGGKLLFLVSSMESYGVVDEKLAPLAHMYQRNTLVYMWYSERAVFTYTGNTLSREKERFVKPVTPRSRIL